MHKTFKTFLLSTSAVAMMASVSFAADYTMLKINGADVKKSEVVDAWEAVFPTGQAPEFDGFDPKVKDNVLRGIISEHVLLQQANKEELGKSPEVVLKVEQLRRKVMVQSLLEKKAGELVAEDETKAAYDALVKEQRDIEEVKARHILVKEEDEAKEIAKKIEDGEEFDALAKELSVDKASGAVGGDLGWFGKEQMVKPFAEAAFKLKEGEVSAPVQSQFGWHVIKLEDRRKKEIPTYSDAKDALKKKLEEEKLAEYVEGLLKNAEIEVLDEKGKEVDFKLLTDEKK